MCIYSEVGARPHHEHVITKPVTSYRKNLFHSTPLCTPFTPIDFSSIGPVTAPLGSFLLFLQKTWATFLKTVVMVCLQSAKSRVGVRQEMWNQC